MIYTIEKGASSATAGSGMHLWLGRYCLYNLKYISQLVRYKKNQYDVISKFCDIVDMIIM